MSDRRHPIYVQRAAKVASMLRLLKLMLIAAFMLMNVEPVFSQTKLAFRDAGAATGLREALQGMRGHAAAWGDVNGDGLPDLYVGAFAEGDSKPNRFLLQRDGRFTPDDQPGLRIVARSSGSVFADFDNDGDLDLYVSNLGGGKEGYQATLNKLYRNDQGKLVDVTEGSGAAPAELRGRTVSALDFDGDGLLDLLVADSIFYGSQKRSRLLLNKGGLKFADVSEEIGLPALPGLGSAVADFDLDGRPDFILASAHGGNRLFLNSAKRKLREVSAASELFNRLWSSRGDDTTCGVCVGDVNRDGLPDVVMGHHNDRPWAVPTPVRLYLHRGVKDGEPTFEDVTEQAGLVPLPMKAPHLEIQDFDNDGWPDIYISIVKFANGQPHPIIFQNQGVTGGVSKFRCDALSVNDFPTADDLAVRRNGALFDKINREGKIMYTASAPSGDYDRDGRVDLFLSSWWIESPAMLLHNETAGGHWLDVVVEASGKVNRNGVGSLVKVYKAGKLGDAKELLSSGEIAVGYGYSSGQEAVAHVGLGKVDRVDVEITLPHNSGKLVERDVKANQRLVVRTK